MRSTYSTSDASSSISGRPNRSDTARFSIRAFVSFALLVGGIIVATAGVILFVAPTGRVANLTDWRLLGLTRPEWQAIRTIFALLFIVLAPIHVYVNWRTFWGYLRRRSPVRTPRRIELAAAMVVMAVAFTLTLQGAQPFAGVIAFGERMSASWPVPEAQPPVSQTETLTPGTGTGTGGGSGSGAQPGAGTGEGLGRLTLAAFCDQEGIPLTDAVRRLEAAGITGQGNDRLRILAAAVGRQPNEVADIARGP
jgi:hypothetical protein